MGVKLRTLALLPVLGIVAVLAAGQFLIHPVASQVGPPPADLAGATTVSLSGRPGESVKGWLVPGQRGRGVILLLHGVHSDRRAMLSRARFLRTAGYSTLLIDFPGHGESTPNAVTFGFHESSTVHAALAFLRTRFPGEPLAIIGVSMGAAAAVLAQPSPAADAVVLEAMYPTIKDAVEDRLELHIGSAARPLSALLLWQLPFRLDISPDQLRPLSHIGTLGGEVLVIGGALDRHTKADETRRLFAAAAQPKGLWMLEGAAHVDFHAYAGSRYEQAILALLDRTMRHGCARRACTAPETR